MSVPPKRMRASPSYLLYKVGEVCSTKEFPYDRLSFGRRNGANQVEFTEWETRRNAKSVQEMYICIYIFTIRRMAASTTRLSDKVSFKLDHQFLKELQ